MCAEQLPSTQDLLKDLPPALAPPVFSVTAVLQNAQIVSSAICCLINLVEHDVSVACSLAHLKHTVDSRTFCSSQGIPPPSQESALIAAPPSDFSSQRLVVPRPLAPRPDVSTERPATANGTVHSSLTAPCTIHDVASCEQGEPGISDPCCVSERHIERSLKKMPLSHCASLDRTLESNMNVPKGNTGPTDAIQQPARGSVQQRVLSKGASLPAAAGMHSDLCKGRDVLDKVEPVSPDKVQGSFFEFLCSSLRALWEDADGACLDAAAAATERLPGGRCGTTSDARSVREGETRCVDKESGKISAAPDSPHAKDAGQVLQVPSVAWAADDTVAVDMVALATQDDAKARPVTWRRRKGKLGMVLDSVPSGPGTGPTRLRGAGTNTNCLCTPAWIVNSTCPTGVGQQYSISSNCPMGTSRGKRPRSDGLACSRCCSACGGAFRQSSPSSSCPKNTCGAHWIHMDSSAASLLATGARPAACREIHMFARNVDTLFHMEAAAAARMRGAGRAGLQASKQAKYALHGSVKTEDGFLVESSDVTALVNSRSDRPDTGKGAAPEFTSGNRLSAALASAEMSGGMVSNSSIVAPQWLLGEGEGCTHDLDVRSQRNSGLKLWGKQARGGMASCKAERMAVSERVLEGKVVGVGRGASVQAPQGSVRDSALRTAKRLQADAQDTAKRLQLVCEKGRRGESLTNGRHHARDEAAGRGAAPTTKGLQANGTEAARVAACTANRLHADGKEVGKDDAHSTCAQAVDARLRRARRRLQQDGVIWAPRDAQAIVPAQGAADSVPVLAATGDCRLRKRQALVAAGDRVHLNMAEDGSQLVTGTAASAADATVVDKPAVHLLEAGVPAVDARPISRASRISGRLRRDRQAGRKPSGARDSQDVHPVGRGHAGKGNRMASSDAVEWELHVPGNGEPANAQSLRVGTKACSTVDSPAGMAALRRDIQAQQGCETKAAHRCGAVALTEYQQVGCTACEEPDWLMASEGDGHSRGHQTRLAHVMSGSTEVHVGHQEASLQECSGTRLRTTQALACTRQPFQSACAIRGEANWTIPPDEIESSQHFQSSSLPNPKDKTAQHGRSCAPVILEAARHCQSSDSLGPSWSAKQSVCPGPCPTSSSIKMEVTVSTSRNDKDQQELEHVQLYCAVLLGLLVHHCVEFRDFAAEQLDLRRIADDIQGGLEFYVKLAALEDQSRCRLELVVAELRQPDGL
jgi:hypothetical protein